MAIVVSSYSHYCETKFSIGCVSILSICDSVNLGCRCARLTALRRVRYGPVRFVAGHFCIVAALRFTSVVSRSSVLVPNVTSTLMILITVCWLHVLLALIFIQKLPTSALIFMR